MGRVFEKKVKALRSLSNLFDNDNNSQRLLLLEELSKIKLQANQSLLHYFDRLIFICAYPANKETHILAEMELSRIATFMKRRRNRNNELFTNSGLPFTLINSSFSVDCIKWMISKPELNLEIDRFENPSQSLNKVLNLTLPSAERSATTAGFNSDELFEALLVKRNGRLSFLINEISKLNDQPFVMDLIFDGLGLYLNIQSANKAFSRSFNRILPGEIFFHYQLLKQFDHNALIESELPSPTILKKIEKEKIINVVRNSMALTDRETDPTTYLDERSFRIYDLDRGISIALYGMIPSRQLPYESYVGYTLFKNGFPTAYGGAWVFGEYANFGINVFENFRGGESGFIFCQLLRVYRKVFGINYFEVEPYQFGLDNPEGIESASFWFYYRYGFRPLDNAILKLSKFEYKKLKASRRYRTSKKTLMKFTESNIVLKLENRTPVKVADLTSKITRMIQRSYEGNRLAATDDCIMKFKQKAGMKSGLNKNENQVLEEVSLLAEALKIRKKGQLNLLAQMIKTKSIDLYSYQILLLRFFGS